MLALRAKTIQPLLFSQMASGKSIDVSCGDGIFSFIVCGGQLSEDVDVFQTVKPVTFRKGDYDMFNYFDDSYRVNVIKLPTYRYTFGTDWKDSLLRKAERLNFYHNLINHDNNYAMPFEDGVFNLVYSNSAYWVEQFEFHLNELARITQKDGMVILEMKTDAIKQYTSKQYLSFMGQRFHEIIDAGRLSTWKGLKSIDQLMSVLTSIKGLKLEMIEPIYGDCLAMIWDIGLRPLISPLTKMANNIEEHLRTKVKMEWVEILYELFAEYLTQYKAKKDTAIEFLFVLRKK